MVIRVREAGKARGFTVPCPLGLVRLVVAVIPQRVFDRIAEKAEEDREKAGEAMDELPLSKGLALDLLAAVTEVGRAFKGLEIVHVESRDGAVVSITL